MGLGAAKRKRFFEKIAKPFDRKHRRHKGMESGE
jgi:hypothetical protein